MLNDVKTKEFESTSVFESKKEVDTYIEIVKMMGEQINELKKEKDHLQNQVNF